jgi:diadenosine tetraphosphate (Ap4A) HIT family hydrolase
MTCPLCNPKNENIIYKNDFIRIILVDEIPGYIRIIIQKHIKEFSELSDKEAKKLALIIKNLEKGILKALKPDKINIASLGNMVPHLHIHMIPRYIDDPWWPDATFCAKKREFNYPPFNKQKYKDALLQCLKNSSL